MKKVIFEIIRTAFFIASYLLIFILIGVGANELYCKYYEPLFTVSTSEYYLLTAFKVVGATSLLTMPIFVFGMLRHSYHQRQTVKDGQETVKIGLMFAIMLMVLPMVLLVWQERIEAIGYFTCYWIAVFILAEFAKNAPETPLFVELINNFSKKYKLG